MTLKHLALVAFGGLLTASLSLGAFAQDVDLKKYPDYKPFDPALQKHMPQQQSRGAARSTSTAQRPDHVNNALSIFYPPVFNQSGGSCGSAQAIGYIFTHDMNNMRGTDASYEENQYPTHFTWLFTTAGVDKQTIGNGNGIPNVSTYGGRTYSSTFGYQDTDNYYFGWMQGYDKWYQAMHNRIIDFFYGPRFTDWLGAREELKQWLWNHWGEEGYVEGGCAGIGVASALSSAAIPSTATNDALGVSGKQYVTHWGDVYNHGVTVCGYDDRIEFDLNGNGIYGEESADEKGAWIICNSWGSWWKNDGFIYCPYANSYCMVDKSGNQTLPWATELYHYRHNYRPLQTIKVLMDYDHRWELSLSGGIAQDTSATKPEATVPFTHFQRSTAFDQNGQSPECPMLGRWGNTYHYEPMEFGYDLTALAASYDRSKPLKYFFIIKTTDNGLGKGHLYKASILNYEYDEDDPVEIPFQIDTLAIDSGGTTLQVAVVVPGEQVNAPLNAVLNGTTLTWSAPEATSLQQNKYYIYKGGALIDSTGITRRSYNVPDASATYTVAAVYTYKDQQLVSPQSNNASAPVLLTGKKNNVLTLNGGGITVPNAIPTTLNQATIEFMVKPTALAATANKTGNENGNFFVNLTASGQVSAGWSTNASTDYATTSVVARTLNKWYHVAVVVDRHDLTIYVDGMKKRAVTSKTYSGVPAIGDFVMGLSSGLMKAGVDELRIWKTARTMSEIYSNKDESIANPSALADLIVYVPMDTIEDEGEIKLREYASGKHAYFNNTDYALATDTTILRGSSFAMKPSITAAQDSAVAGTPVKYSAVSALSSTSWQWSAPGATQETFSTQSPYITYNTAGNHTLTLTITNANGTTQQITKDIYVREAALPVVDFQASTLKGDAGTQFSFINRSSGANTVYTWTLEGADEPVLHTTNATAIYNAPGTYNVVLTGQNATGTASASKTITVSPAAPRANFMVSPSAILLGETTYLTDRSNGAPTSWAWLLDNGKHSQLVNGQNSSIKPAHPGIYDVSLTTSNEVGFNTKTEQGRLVVSNADAKNSLAFSGGQSVSFQCPLSQNSKQWTIEWWMNPSTYIGAGSMATDNGFFSMGGVGGGALRLTINNSSLESSTGYIVPNEWHHYAVAYALGTVRFYRDGELWETPESKLSYTAGKWLGQMTLSPSSAPFTGLIDELRFWSSNVTGSNIRARANAPLENPESVSRLALYYDFNDGQGDVTDLSAAHLNGTRNGFGPDGDAWPVNPGVFTLDTDASTSTVTDVTSQYLTNYKAPFLYDENTVVNDYRANRFYALQTGTAESTWQTAGAAKSENSNAILGAHVDTGDGSGLSYTAGYFNFAFVLSNNRVWQTVTLPAGKYTFREHASRYSGNYSDCKLVVNAGDELSTNENVASAIAQTPLSGNDSLTFILSTPTQVSLGVLYNTGSYMRYVIDSFSLSREDIDVVEADGETSIYDAVRNGNANVITPKEGGILIASENKENFRIFTLDGRCVMNEDVHGVHFIPMPAGVYICNGQKFQVK